MHICLNLVGGKNWIGGAIYVQNLARSIFNLPNDEKSDLELSIISSVGKREFVRPIEKYVNQVYLNNKLNTLFLRSRGYLSHIFPILPSSYLNLEGIDFLYPALGRTYLPACWGGWIPDFQAYYLPEFFKEAHIARIKSKHKQLANHAPIIVFSSEVAVRDFNKFYPKSFVPTSVLHFSTFLEPEWLEPDPRVFREKYELPEHFFLVSNQLWKHKDHNVVIEALNLLKQEGNEITVAFTGSTADPRNPQHFTQLLDKIKAYGLGRQVRILGLVPRLHQIQLMRCCLSVIQPSTFEGWSTVIEDAKTLGKSIVASDFPVHMEQAPANAIFFEKGNFKELSKCLLIVLQEVRPVIPTNEELRQKNLEVTRQFARNFLGIASDFSLRNV